MFCSNCGKENADGAKFCNSCGATLAIDVNQSAHGQRQQTRNSEIMEIDRMIRYFSQKSEQYKEYDELGDFLTRYTKGKHYTLLIWGIILVVLGLIVIGAIVNTSGTGSTAVLACILLLPGAGMIVGHIFYAKNFDNKMSYSLARYAELSQELLDHYNNYGICSVGAEYTNPANLSVIKATIESGRADTIKEAINILIDDAHRNNMEQIAAQTARNTAVAARGTTVAAVFSAANFFRR